MKKKTRISLLGFAMFALTISAYQSNKSASTYINGFNALNDLFTLNEAQAEKSSCENGCLANGDGCQCNGYHKDLLEAN